MAIPDHILRRFERLPDEHIEQLLAPPQGQVRLIIDTDTANEIDDQFALAWALLSPDRLSIEGITAEPYSFQHLRPGLLEADAALEAGALTDDAQAFNVGRSFRHWAAALRKQGRDPAKVKFVTPEEGEELSYAEILRVHECLGMDPAGKVRRGSAGYLDSADRPIRSPSAELIVERALAASDRPLYVAAMGCLTNIASALLMEPAIRRNMVVLWTAGYPSFSYRGNAGSLNLEQDVLASQVLFDSGVAQVYLPGFDIGAQLRISLPEMEQFVRGRGKMGDYLYHLYTHNPIHHQRGVEGLEWRTWVIWDMIDIAWLLDPDWVPSQIVPSPRLDDDLYWRREPGRHRMREAFDIDRDSIFHDFYVKLAAAAGQRS
jgi:purine nucleosidase